MKIAFILPSLGMSGGVGVVLDYARGLANLGNAVTIFCLESEGYSGWNGPCNFEIKHIEEDNNDYSCLLYDVAVSTFWTTVNVLRNGHINAKLKYLLVQGIEEDFYSDSDANTRSKVRDAVCGREVKICVSRYLKEVLSARYGQPSWLVVNGVNLDVFKPADPLISKGARLRVVIEGHHMSRLKMVREAYEVLLDASVKSGILLDVWIISSSKESIPNFFKPGVFLRGVPKEKMPYVYNSCDIIFKLSKTEGFGLAPLEAMACGVVPIVNDFGGQRDYLIDTVNGFCINPSDSIALSRILIELSKSDYFLNVKNNALKTASEFNWNKSVEGLSAIFTRLSR